MEEIAGLKAFSKLSDTLRAGVVVADFVVWVTAEFTFSVTIAVLILTCTDFSYAHHCLIVHWLGLGPVQGLRSVLGLSSILVVRPVLGLSSVLVVRPMLGLSSVLGVVLLPELGAARGLDWLSAWPMVSAGLRAAGMVGVTPRLGLVSRHVAIVHSTNHTQWSVAILKHTHI